MAKPVRREKVTNGWTEPVGGSSISNVSNGVVAAGLVYRVLVLAVASWEDTQEGLLRTSRRGMGLLALRVVWGQNL